MLLATRRYRLQMTEEDTSGGGGFASPSPEAPAPTPAPWDSRPHNWEPTVDQDWTSTPESVRKYVHRREQEAAAGIAKFKDGSRHFETLADVFKDIRTSNPQFDVPGTYRTLAENHLALQRASAAERKELFRELAKFYEVDYGAPAGPGGAPNEPAAPFSAEQLTALRSVLSPVIESHRTIESERQAAKAAEAKKAVDSFFSDPKNKHLNEVGEGLAEIIKSGKTTDLGEAYRLALMRNPTLWSKYVADLHAESAQQPPASQLLNVRSSAAAPPAVKGKDMDSTMAAIVRKHYAT